MEQNFDEEHLDVVQDIITDIFGDDPQEEEEDYSVHEEQDDEGTDPICTDDDSVPDRTQELALICDKKYLVSESKLLELIRSQRCHCGQSVNPATIRRGKHVAAAAHYMYTCYAGHELKWISSDFYGGKSAAHLLLHLAVLLSGMTWAPFSLAMKFLNVAVGSASNFYRYQRLYHTAISKFFDSAIQKTREKFHGKSVCIAIDVRYDTPGFSANKCTTVFMEYKTGDIIHVEVGDSREVGRSSNRLECHTITRGMAFLKSTGIQVTEVVTDASRSIISLFSQPIYQEIGHSLDVWHKAKKIAQTLGEAGRKASGRDVIPWIKTVVNHFWWSCANCNSNKERLRTMWVSILHHISDVHDTPLYSCPHGPMAVPESRKWLTKESAAYSIVKSVVLNKQWLGSLKFYSKNRHTSRVENFNSHTLLRYCPKRLSFSYDGYVSRNQLAVLDYNHHHLRDPAVTQDGQICVQGQVSRRTREWVAYRRLTVKDYGYIQDLTAKCMVASYGVSTTQASETAARLQAAAPNMGQGKNPGSRELYHSRLQRSSGV